MRASYSRGFTIVEILVTITVMVILLTMAVFISTNQMISARDNEREQDAGNIARGLERYHNINGQYPSKNVTYSLTTPVLPSVSPGDYYLSFNGESVLSLKPTSLANNAAIPTNDSDVITSSNDIIYLPLIWSGSRWEVCDGAEVCSRFRLYYRLERADEIKIIESRRQQ